MKLVRCIAVVLPLAVVVGCGKEEPNPVSAPAPPPPPEVLKAEWITDEAALASAVRSANASPLVQRAISDVPIRDLTPMPQYALRAVGTLGDGSRVGVTILPFMVGQDPTHALFVTLIEGGEAGGVDVGELILGRSPTTLEDGFRAIMLGDRVGWYRGVEVGTTAPKGVPHPSAERRNWTGFLECMLGFSLAACKMGAEIGLVIAPVFPHSAAIGCGAGVALTAVSCGMAHLEN
jgi:hypothetical protein